MELRGSVGKTPNCSESLHTRTIMIALTLIGEGKDSEEEAVDIQHMQDDVTKIAISLIPN